MKRRLRILALGVSLLVLAVSLPARTVGKQVDLIDWQDWTPATFERATQEKKLVLLNLARTIHECTRALA